MVEHRRRRRPLDRRRHHPHPPLPRRGPRHPDREERLRRGRRPHRHRFYRLDFTRRQIRWSREVPLDTHLANIASHSAFLVLGEEATAEFFTEERAHLRKLFPTETIEEIYDVDLLLAIRP